MNKRITILLISLVFAAHNALAGGGWVNPKGKGFFKLSQWWVISDKHYTDTGNTDPNITTGLFNTSLYAEYGISDKVDGIVYLPFFSRAYSNEVLSGTTGAVLSPGESVNSLGDADIGIKYGFIRNKKFVLSGSFFLGVPLGVDDGGSQGTLQTGDGEFNQRVSLDLSTSVSFGQLNTFYSISLGFNNRNKGFADELRYGFEFGGSFKRLTAIVRFLRVESLENQSISAAATSGATVFASNTEYFSYTYELIYDFNDKFGISANTGSAFSGRLIFANPTYSVGVHMKL